MIVGPVTPGGSIACICNCCCAGAVSSIRGIRIQRMARAKGKLKP
jgi:hypothetical protein